MTIKETTKNGRTQYRLNYYDSNGARVRKFFDKLYQAKAARKNLRADESDLLAVLKVLDDTQKLRLVQAWQTAEDGGFDLLEACVNFTKEHEPTKPVTVKNARVEFIRAKEKIGLRYESLKSYKSSFGNFGAAFDSRKFDLIEAFKVSQWLEPQGYSPVRHNRMLSDLTTLWNWAGAQGYGVGKKNPFKLERIKVDQLDVCILAIDDVEPYLIEAMKVPEIAAVVVLVLLCGLRVSEAIQMTWADIDVDDGVVTVRGSIAKLRIKRINEPEPNAIEWLKHAKTRGGTLPVSQSVYDKKRRGNLPTVGPNALRHSFCSYHLAKFKNIGATAEQAGNSPEMIQKHYKKAVRVNPAQKFWEVRP
jgi:integrase